MTSSINISKKRKSSIDPESNLTMGLNSRGGVEMTRSLNRKRTSVLDDATEEEDDDAENHNDDDDDDCSQNLSGRQAVNRAIAKQQAAIRAKVTAAATSMDASIYDYDGVYDSIQSNRTADTTVASSSNATTDTKKSRYIEDLMKTAKVRKMERDIAYDRKIARDQKVEEEMEPEFRNKDRFITSSYKRQLEERLQYEQQESIRQQIEENNDITKCSNGEGFGIASLYGNIISQQQQQQQQSLSRSTKTDAAILQASSKDTTNIERNQNETQSIRGTTGGDYDSNKEHSARRHHERTRASNYQNHQPSTTNRTTMKDDNVLTIEPQVQEQQQQRMNMRVLRDAKVQAARDRYFQRHPNTVVLPLS